MLKTWMVNPSLDNIHVEEKYHTWCENLRTDRYVTAQTLVVFVLTLAQCFALLPAHCVCSRSPSFSSRRSMERANKPRNSSRLCAKESWLFWVRTSVHLLQ